MTFMDGAVLCSLAQSGSFVHGILQTRILEWFAMPFSRGSSRPRDQTCTSCGSCIAEGFFTAKQPGSADAEHRQHQPHPEIELGSPALQADSLPVELPVQVIETSPEEISGRNLNVDSQM